MHDDLRGVKTVVADIVYLQELYINGGVLARSAYEIRRGTVGERKEQ